MGASIVDYLALSRSLMKNIIKFKVLPPNFDSKHAPITATFKSSFVKFGKGKVLNHPKTCFISLLTEPKRYSGEVREAKV